MKTIKFILPLLSLLTVACRDVPVVDVAQPKGDTLKESLINANRIIAQSEEQQIDAWLARRGWQLDRLSDGVRVSEMGNCETYLGAAIDYDDTVDIAYNVLTLGGDTIYRTREERIVAGRHKPVHGLDAALRTLHEGALALVIVPSEQAYGVVGDGDRIRSRMVLVYNVEVKKVTKSIN